MPRHRPGPGAGEGVTERLAAVTYAVLIAGTKSAAMKDPGPHDAPQQDWQPDGSTGTRSQSASSNSGVLGSPSSNGQLARWEAAVAVDQLPVDPLALLGEQEPDEVRDVDGCS